MADSTTSQWATCTEQDAGDGGRIRQSLIVQGIVCAEQGWRHTVWVKSPNGEYTKQEKTQERPEFPLQEAAWAPVGVSEAKWRRQARRIRAIPIDRCRQREQRVNFTVNLLSLVALRLHFLGLRARYNQITEGRPIKHSNYLSRKVTDAVFIDAKTLKHTSHFFSSNAMKLLNSAGHKTCLALTALVVRHRGKYSASHWKKFTATGVPSVLPSQTQIKSSKHKLTNLDVFPKTPLILLVNVVSLIFHIL